jgi:hypothetical protein
MRKAVCFFFVFSLFLHEAAIADTIGLTAGLYMDSPDVAAEDRQYFLTPQLEYEHSFGNFDLYVEGEYTFSLNQIYPQFFFSEERIAVHLPVNSRSEFLIGLHNENDFRFNPDRNDGWSAGRVMPEVTYSLSLRPGDISLALGTPLPYLMRGGKDTGIRFGGFEVTAAYVTPLWIGFEAVADITGIPTSAAVFESMKFAVNYTGDQFYGELAFRAKESFTYFSLKIEFDYFFDFFILWASLEAGNLADLKTAFPVALGIKYRF